MGPVWIEAVKVCIETSYTVRHRIFSKWLQYFLYGKLIHPSVKEDIFGKFFFHIICLIVCMLLVWFIRKDKRKCLRLFVLLTDICNYRYKCSISKKEWYVSHFWNYRGTCSLIINLLIKQEILYDRCMSILNHLVSYLFIC